MAQFKIYGQAVNLRRNAAAMSDVIHRAAVEAFGLPGTKRFHRFFLMDDGLFFTPGGRSEDYTIIECMMFEGRTIETKKLFYRLLLAGMHDEHGFDPHDIEVTIIETPRHNWLIRGLPGDEIELTYEVET